MKANAEALVPSSAPSGAARLATRLVEVGLVVLIAWLAAQAFWFVLFGSAPLAMRMDASTLAGDSAGLSADPSRAMAVTGLFNARAGEIVAVEAAPETRLNLTLRGVRTGSGPGTGAAVIETPGSGQRSIPVGGEISSGVTLEAVFAERVIINRNGSRESLFLTEAAAQRAQTRASAPARPQPGTDTPAPTGAQSNRVLAEGASPLSGTPDLDIARELDREDWVDGLRLAQASENGRMIGMRVRDNSRLETLRASGLLPGDIVLALNGETLSNSDAVSRAIRSLETADQVSLRVRREGEEITLQAPLN